MNPSALISELIEYAKQKNMISEEDEAYSASRLMEILSLSSVEPTKPKAVREISEILSDVCDYAFEAGLIESNSVVYRDLFDTKVMGALTPSPSSVIREFKDNYKISPELATDKYYSLACDSNYIRTPRCA